MLIKWYLLFENTKILNKNTVLLKKQQNSLIFSAKVIFTELYSENFEFKYFINTSWY